MNFVKEHGATDVRPANVRVSACARWRMALFSAAYLAIAMPHLLAAEQTHTTEHESGQYHRNMVELFLGNTHEDAHDETENDLPLVSLMNAVCQVFWVLVDSMNTPQAISTSGVSASRSLFTRTEDGVLPSHRDWSTEKAMMSFSSAREWPTNSHCRNDGL